MTVKAKTVAQEWKKPMVSALVPVRQTRGGSFVNSLRTESGFYSPS